MGYVPKLKIQACLAPLKVCGEFKDETKAWPHDSNCDSWPHFQATMLAAYQKALQDAKNKGTPSFGRGDKRRGHANAAEETPPSKPLTLLPW